MDIGCSSGFMLRMLKEKFPKAAVLGADYICGPLEHLARTLAETPLLQFDLVKCPLPNGSLDAVVLLNVLEHIEDDTAAMRQVARILKPGGVAVIEVPAGPALYDIYDKQLMHHRRYRMSDLVSKLAQSGLRVVERSHLGCFVYPGFWVVKKWGKRFLKQDDRFQQRAVAKRIKTGRSSALLHAVLKLEATFRSGVYYPFGIRCLVTCKNS
jgi:SAM-dependent methyltransferase